MQPLKIEKAKRGSHNTAKILLSGPSGGGKTHSSLIIAEGLTDGKPMATVIVDTEHRSSELYSDRVEFDYGILPIDRIYSTAALTDLILGFEKDPKIEVIIIDSLSHFYSGPGGLSEQVDNLVAQGMNSFQAWGKVAPTQNRLTTAIVASKKHIIACCRSKEDYVMIQRDGKTIPKKVGLAPDQKKGLAYEFTVHLAVTDDGMAMPEKDRTGLFPCDTPFKITRDTGSTLREWLKGEKTK